MTGCKVLFVFLVFILALNTQAQDIKVHGEFLTDSIRIGEPFAYSLSARYPSDKNILFPDSTYNFAPFEYVGKKYFPTESVNGISLDSCLYYLSSFEIDSIQSINLPVFVVQKKDCTRIWTDSHGVWLQHMVTIATDSIEAARLPLKVNAYYEPVSWLFNYPVALIIGGVALVALVVVWVIFGKGIVRYLKAKRMKSSFEKYMTNFTGSLEQLKANYSVTNAEKTFGIWKKYQESLEDVPFTKYTSKEILNVIGHESLAGPLKTVDRLIYAEAKPSNFDAFYDLKSYSEDCFHKKIQELNEKKQ